METTRRDLFKFAAGTAAGFLLTPAPWRLVTDGALWSENWPGIPKPARGPVEARFTHCTLCPAGCAVQARCINRQPIALTGVGGKALCAFGITGHQTPYHAGRILQGPVEQAREAVAKRPAGSIALLDLRPGRTASWTYRRAMAQMRGIYLAPQSALTAVDLRNVQTILSIGVPVLDGWGTPANVLEARGHFRLIQAEAAESHTAMLADLWLPIRAGSEDALAAAVIAGLQKGKPEAGAVERTGLPEAQIAFVAQELARGGGVVLAARESERIMELNGLAGAFGRAIVPRRETPVPANWKTAAPVTALDAVAESSIAALLIDESACDGYFPWHEIKRKLAPEAVVVSFSSSRLGYTRHASFVLPTAVYPEYTDDIPAAPDSAGATFRVAMPLVPAPAGIVDPAQFIGELAGLATGDALRERAAAIHAAARGTLVNYAKGGVAAVRQVTADEFWKTLVEGGCWVDEPGSSRSEKVPRNSSPAIVAMTWEERLARNPMSPLLSKIYQESNLRVRI